MQDEPEPLLAQSQQLSFIYFREEGQGFLWCPKSLLIVGMHVSTLGNDRFRIRRRLLSVLFSAIPCARWY